MKYSKFKKRVLSGKAKIVTDEQANEYYKISKEVNDDDINFLIREAKAFGVMRHPRWYVIVFIFVRYRIPILYYKVVNLITQLFY